MLAVTITARGAPQRLVDCKGFLGWGWKWVSAGSGTWTQGDGAPTPSYTALPMHGDSPNCSKHAHHRISSQAGLQRVGLNTASCPNRVAAATYATGPPRKRAQPPWGHGDGHTPVPGTLQRRLVQCPQSAHISVRDKCRVGRGERREGFRGLHRRKAHGAARPPSGSPATTYCHTA
jgi:hypothetical protein